MTKWYYIDQNNQRQGPHEEEKIIELLQDGYLNAQTLVWADGIGFGGEWAMVSTVPDLSNSIKPLPPEPPPPAPEPPPATDEYVEVEAAEPKTPAQETTGEISSKDDNFLYWPYTFRIPLKIFAVVLLLIIGIIVFLLMSGEDEQTFRQVDSILITLEEETLPEEKLPVTDVVEPLAVPIFLPLESFVLSLKGGRRFLKASIQLMLSEPGAAAYLTVRLVEVKDIVLAELQELSIEDVKQRDAREVLRQRLISAISQIFPIKPEWEDPEPIRKVLFEEFVIQ